MRKERAYCLMTGDGERGDAEETLTAVRQGAEKSALLQADVLSYRTLVFLFQRMDTCLGVFGDDEALTRYSVII
jgi:hypothetical protein